jgi:hypothetical protein
MSDGPHKSLPLRQGWKRVCEIAGNTAHGLDELVERLLPALAADVRHEIGEAFVAKMRKILESDAAQPALFDDVRDQLAGLRREQCSPFQSDLIDSVDDAVRDGQKGLDALSAGAKAAIDTRASATINSVIEHYLRKAPHEAALGVGRRLTAGLQAAATQVSALANGLAIGRLAAAVPGPTPRSDLDDGPSL